MSEKLIFTFLQLTPTFHPVIISEQQLAVTRAQSQGPMGVKVQTDPRHSNRTRNATRQESKGVNATSSRNEENIAITTMATV